MNDPHNPPEPPPVSAYIPGRYPYTYCADHIRCIIGGEYYDGMYRGYISRAQAAGLKRSLARILGMDEAELASKIADDYLRQNRIEKT